MKSKKPVVFLSDRNIPFIIGGLFVLFGIMALLLSAYANSSIIALIGLGLVFWGVLFTLIIPRRANENTLLSSAAIAIYLTVDRIIEDFKYSGKAYYIPPYSQEEHLPENLKGLNDVAVLISPKNNASMVPIQMLASRQFMISKEQGVLITPPGIGLLIEIERMLAPTEKMQISDLLASIPKIIENFELARSISLCMEADRVNLTLQDSIYENLFMQERNLTSIYLLGCPITSAIACLIGKNTGKTVTIENTKISSEGLTINIEYRLV
jgi:hypothetical protein